MDEITAEFPAVAPERPEVTLHTIPRITYAARTDIGRVRSNNEDKHDLFLPEDEWMLAARGLAFIVCDGMGGHEAGQIASELACKTFIQTYYNHPGEDPADAAITAVRAAHRFVLDTSRQPGRNGMGCTLTALILVQDKGLLLQVGDSRLYRFRAGELQQLSPEHTYIAEQIRLGLLKPEDAHNSPYAHVLMRCIGVQDTVEPDIAAFDPAPGDLYLLCSDGLTDMLDDNDIANVLAANTPSSAAWELVDRALANGGRDNVTALLVRLDDLEILGHQLGPSPR